MRSRHLVFLALASLALSACTSQSPSASSSSPSSTPSVSLSPSTVGTPSPSTSLEPVPSSPSLDAAALPSATESAPAPAETSAESSPETTTPAAEQVAVEGPEENLAPSGPITQRGTKCEQVTEDKALILASAPEGFTCESAQRIMSQALTVGSEPTDVLGFSCFTRDEAGILLEGRSTTCTAGETRLEAMENYTLAGSPVSSTTNYPTQLGSIQVYGFSAHGLDCYFGKLGGVSCWRPSVLMSLPFETASISGSGFRFESIPDIQDAAVVQSAKQPLQPGEVISTHGVSCNNDGTYINCRLGESWFTMNSSELHHS